ncbi:MAG: preprotein translocase subunit SecE [Gemmatimonadetes bacterium]|nr:preprotein translocase subunit SecE [Gemmatimonadota bacterium]
MADSIRSIRDFAGDVRTELQKVTWPDQAQLKNSTFVILVFVIALSLIIFAMDFLMNNGLHLLRSVLGG